MRAWMDDYCWSEERRAEVAAYLRRERVSHGRISKKPIWHVIPYVSLWAIETAAASESIGWWVICGDLPTDYVSIQQAADPREALRAFAARWREVADYMSRGDRHPTIEIGEPATWPKLAPLLKLRARLLTSSVDDERLRPNDQPLRLHRGCKDVVRSVFAAPCCLEGPG